MLKRKFSIAILLIIAVLSIFGKNGLLEYLKFKNELKSMRAQLADLKKENIDKSSELYGLNTSREFLEKKSREELKLSKPDETIYLFNSKE